jgi:mannose/fructose/N-acetylgalactosamine-specific phosphotransferase system component IIC
MKRILMSCVALLSVAGCGALPAVQPADPAVAAKIAAACAASGWFKVVEGAVTIALPVAALPAAVLNAGVAIVCADPARFAADISTVEWVIKNLPKK